MHGGFPEKISSFLVDKLAQIEGSRGAQSPDYLGVARQYVRTRSEDVPTLEGNLRHYKAGLGKADGLQRAERLYRRTAVINLTQACLASCRFCLRSNYPNESLSLDQLRLFAQYCGSAENRDDLVEILVTGGDPLLARSRLQYLIGAIRECSPNIRCVRIGSRLPLHDPARVDNELLTLLRDSSAQLSVELAIQINHPAELFPECRAALARIAEVGVTIYAQNVLLKGINDDVAVLAELYDSLRGLGVESHYLFHCCPIVGTRHFRTSLQRGLQLAHELTASGRISGRSKPQFAAMTDVGKVVLYEGALLDRRDERVLIQSHYSYADRMRWNPHWELPHSAELDSDGLLRVWYLDGDDAPGPSDTIVGRSQPPRAKRDVPPLPLQS